MRLLRVRKGSFDQNGAARNAHLDARVALAHELLTHRIGQLHLLSALREIVQLDAGPHDERKGGAPRQRFPFLQGLEHPRQADERRHERPIGEAVGAEQAVLDLHLDLRVALLLEPPLDETRQLREEARARADRDSLPRVEDDR